MSALGGYFSRSGAGVDTRLLRRLSARMTQIGPDGESFEISTKVGMLFRPFITHDEVRRAQRPVVDHEGFMITFDGWLDNRSEVIALLGSDLPRCNPTVPEIVLSVFKRWGVDGFAKLVGNFAFALWDSHSEQLYLAADSLGMRSLYFYVDKERVVWSSRARALVDACHLPAEIDLDYFAAFVTNSLASQSPFENVRSVTGGHVLIIGRHLERRQRYWSFDQGREVRHTCDEAYEEEFRHIFMEAISSRLQGGRKVFVEVSGGVDSSSIACIADHLLKRGCAESSEMATVSYVYDRSASSDERPYIRAVEEFIDAGVNHHLHEEEHPIFDRRLLSQYYPDLPGNRICFLRRTAFLSRLMEESGARVLLSGIGGDQAFLAESHDRGLELDDLWLEGRWLEWLVAGHRWSRALGRSLLQTLLDRWKGTQRVAPLGSWARRDRGDLWFRRPFIERCEALETACNEPQQVSAGLPSRARQCESIRRAFRHYALQMDTTHNHFEQRYPYLDRRLLEFALAIPLEQKLRIRESRSLVRRALSGRMPEAVLQRRTKAGVEEAMQRAVIREQRWLRGLFESSILEDLGVIDSKRFLETLRRLCHGAATDRMQAYRTISLELWLRTFRQGAEPGAVASAREVASA